METKKLKFDYVLLTNIILAVAILVMDVCLIVLGNAYVFKSIASALFVVSGISNLVFAIMAKEERNKLFKYFMTIGLVFACIGDILLIDGAYFIEGAIFFAIGHVFFFVGYSLLQKLCWRDLIIGLIIFAIALVVILAVPVFEFQNMLAIVIVYAFIISFMLGKAISNAFSKEYKIGNLIILIGSLLFFLSDLMLLFNVFTNFDTNVFSILCLALYYPAEILLACSIYYKDEKLTENENLKKINEKSEKN